MRALLALFAKGGDSDDEIARRVVGHGFGPAAVFLLEAVKPMSFVTGSALTVLSPLGHAFLEPESWDALPEFLEDRERVESLLRAIERELDLL